MRFLRLMSIMLSLCFVLGLSYGASTGELSKEDITTKIKELEKFKNDSENLLLKISIIASSIVFVLSLFGGKEIINLKKSIKLANNKVNKINNMEKITLFRFMIDDYNNIMRREGNSTEGENYLLQLKAKKIIYEYEELSKDDMFLNYPLEAYHLSVIADAYFELGHVKTAKKLFDKAYIMDPENSRANYGIAFCIERIIEDENNKINKDLLLKERINHLILASKIEPLNIVYLTDLGFTYIVVKEFDKAEYCFRKAYDIDPKRFANYASEYVNDEDVVDYFKSEKGKKVLALIEKVKNTIDFSYLRGN